MKDKHLLLRSASFVMVVIIVVLSALFVFALDSAYKHVIEETKVGFDNNIKVAVETVIGSLKANHQQVADGLISEEDAIETAKTIVRDARYSSAPDKDNDGYFWADMADGSCVVHYNPNNEGAMRWNAQDLEGNYYIQTFIKNGNAGGDYSDFYFGKPGDENGSYQKRGYTEKFEPYGWYISTGNYYEDTDIVLNQFARQELIWLVTIGIFVVVSIVFVVMLTRWMTKQIYWYENILDNIPSPLSITDTNGNWTFINKPVETMLGKTRAEMIGKHCSNWGAGICNTENCGIKCIERGQTATTFSQGGMDFKVDVAYLTDRTNKRTGHIEVVHDITEIVKSQKAEAELVKEIEDISHSFFTASTQIADGAQLLSQTANEQAATIQQLSEASNEIAVKTKANADMAGKTASLADTIKGNAEKGSRQMSEMIRAVEEINDASQRINKVIKTIDDIAFQTNILALNAAVEAARAGQHGKGFAVVAEEVRNLATKSAAAAKDTASLIENSMEKAALGAQIAGETETSLSEIVSGINESSRLITEMAKSSEEQSADIDQIHKGIGQMAQIVRQNNETAKQEATASEEMRGQSAILDDLITTFKEKSGEANRALPPR